MSTVAKRRTSVLSSDDELYNLRKVQRYAMILPYRGRVILTGAKRYYEYRSDNIAKRYYTMPNDKTLG